MDNTKIIFAVDPHYLYCLCFGAIVVIVDGGGGACGGGCLFICEYIPEICFL